MQWLDDLDDLVGAIGLIAERLRRTAVRLAVISTSLSVQLAGIYLALHQPPLALAAALLLFIMLLYHTVTSPRSLKRSVA
ncbi:MAG: hypothetical protein KJO82_09585 [Gammaproteobacteria bacterium]|nr:hypothetical protein [Gammaproteobacteria bacterium]